MAPYEKIKWVVLSTTVFATTVCCVENQSNYEWPEFRSLDNLTKNLNQLAVQAKIPIKIVPGKTMNRKSLRNLVKTGAIDPSKANEASSLPESRVPPQVEAVSVSGISTRLGSFKNGLPLAEARVINPVRQKWNSKEFTESPWSTETNQKERDVVATFTPPFTRFGTDRYDKAMFDSSKKDSVNALTDEQGGIEEAGRSMGGLLAGGEPLQEGDKKKKTQEQEARESLQKTMKEFAERDDEKETFQLVDYFDLRNVLAKNSQLLTSFENDEIDERFVKNAQIVFERFGGRDNAPDKKPFEVFLKKMEPPSPQFKSFNSERVGGDRKRVRHLQR